MAAAGEHDVPVRLVGGLAVRLHADPLHPAFVREYKDVDVVTLKGRGRDVDALVEALEYEPEAEFNALNGHRRLMYELRPDGPKLDVFVGEFAMCHRIPVTDRIELDPVTLPLAELLLTKLQIVELGDRDLRDTAALLYHHEVGAHDEDAINADRVAELCAADWGLWRTCTMNVGRIRDGLGALELEEAGRALIRDRLDVLSDRIEAEPKPTRWRIRDRVGDRVRWYELPEEVG
jgi:hypothetical protein